MIFAFMTMGPMEMMVIGAIAVILFGSKLPEVARSVGKSYR
ncbi:MAG: twin-arginine translocase TatA/TatE family subunit, partial [Pirellulaceae bacterium]